MGIVSMLLMACFCLCKGEGGLAYEKLKNVCNISEGKWLFHIIGSYGWL